MRAAIFFASLGPAVLALCLPALAADDSLVLQPAATSTGPGGTVEIRVLARLHPDGKAVVPVRAADVVLTARGGGTVAPASETPGELKWIYRAPDAVGANLDVTLAARVRSYPDAAGACMIRVNAPASATAPAGATAGRPPAEDEDGDLVEGAKAEPADPVGKLVTLERWRARGLVEEPWNEKTIPERGEPLVAMGFQQEFRFRINSPKVASVEIRWWRNDRPERVRNFTETNKHLSASRDQDGFVHVVFMKELWKTKGEYTFTVLVRTEDGRVQKESLVVRRDRPKDEDAKEKGGRNR